MKNRKYNLKKLIKNYGLFMFLVILILIFSLFTKRFLSLANLVNILKRISITGILSLGMLFVIISGGIDISVGAVAALASVVMATFLLHFQSVVLMILVLFALSLLVGSLIGLVVAKGHVPPIITTLAALSIIRGALMIYTGGFTIEGVTHPVMSFIGRGKALGIPIMVWIMGGAYILTSFILKKTQFGRYVYAIGGDEEVSRLSGVHVTKVRIFVYMYASCMSVLGGIVLCARLGVGQPTAVDGIELDCIAAVVLGGASLSGGKGKVLQTFIGVLIMGLLINGMNYLKIVTYWQYIIQGLVILLATLIYSERR